MIGDLPRGVMAQWRRWCLHPEYAAGVEPGARELYASVRTPITSISFTDDDFMSERNIDSIHDLYSGVERRRIRIRPDEVGERSIGHFGCFRRRFEASLWRKVLLPELASRPRRLSPGGLRRRHGLIFPETPLSSRETSADGFDLPDSWPRCARPG